MYLYILHLNFNVPLDKAQKELLRVGKIARGNAMPVMHGSHTAGYVFEAREGIQEVRLRIGRELDGVTYLANWWIIPAPTAIEAKHGGIDPFSTRLREAWSRLAQRRQSKYVGDRQAG